MKTDEKGHRCGRPAGYVAHRRLGEEPCRACKQAWANYYRDRRAKGRKQK